MGKSQQPVMYSVVDAFTESPFKGNPAVICLLEDEREEQWLQAVASEFNMPVTCYLTRILDHDSETQKSSESTRTPRFHLRWFTILTEINICGHATLATAHFLFTSGLVTTDTIDFLTLSGVLTAKRVFGSKKSDSLLTSQNGEAQESFFIDLDFPIAPSVEFHCSNELSLISKALNGAYAIEIRKITTTKDILIELPLAKAVEDFQPQFDDIEKCPGRGMIITGLAPPETEFDFVSRFFCPKLGVNEDHVCGAAHTALAPYWSKKLGKYDLFGYQASSRGGILNMHIDEKSGRMILRGKAVLVMRGSLLV